MSRHLDEFWVTMLTQDLLNRRRTWMATLARAERSAIEAQLSAEPALPDHTRLRGPEAGLVMVRGRMGGSGAPFNLGEMTVTRCTIRNARGQIGHAYIAGRDGQKAELAAALDAALQDPDSGAGLEARVIAPLAEALTLADKAIRAEAEATRVDFFTLATMRS